jgi:RNA polymerase sigma factor for flagellar operon FliA
MNRDELYEKVQPLLHTIVSQYAVTTPVAFEELESVAQMGAIAALDRYKPESGVPFHLYARHRIRGAILDYLRELDYTSRDARRHCHTIDRVQQALEQRFMRNVTSAEIAEELGITVNKLDERRLAVSPAVSIESFNQPEQKRTNATTWQPSSGPAPQHGQVEWEQIGRLLEDVQLTLPPRYRRILEMYYLQEITMLEIGKIMGVNESRISQIVKEALRRLREQMHGRGFTSSEQLLPRAA